MAIITLITILLVHLYIVSKLVFFPYPELLVYPYLTNIGLTPYLQIFDQHFPGLMFLPLNLGNTFFSKVDSLFYLNGILIFINHFLIYFVSKSILKDKYKPLVANLFYLLWHPYMEGYAIWIDSFMPLFLLPSFYFFINSKGEKYRNFYISALILGFGLVLKQVVLPLILLLSLYIWIVDKNYRRSLIFLTISSLPMALVSLYYLKLGIFDEFFYWTVTFNLTTFADLGRKYPTLLELVKMFVIFSPGLIYLLLNLKKNIELILFIYLFGSLFFAYARFDFVHTQPALSFLSTIISIAIYKLPKFLRSNLVIIYILAMLVPINSRLNELRREETMFFTDLEQKLVEHVVRETEEGDTIFVFGTTPHLYYMTNTRPPSDLFVFQFPWFLLEVEDEILNGIKNDPPKIVIQDKEASTSGMKLVDYAPRIGEYIRQNYILHDKIGNTEVLLPKK